MKKWSFIALFLIATLVFVSCPPPAPPPAPPPKPEVFKWRMGAGWPAGLLLFEADKYFAKKVTEMSGGRLTISNHPAGEIVPPFELLDAVGKGVLEAGSEVGHYWTGKNTAFDLIGSFSFGFTPVDYINWMYHGGGLELTRELYGRYKVHYVPYALIPMESGFRTNKPIHTAADFKGLILRTPHTQTMWVLEQLGAKPVKLPLGEIYMAMKLGTIDGTEISSPAICWGIKIYEVAKYWVLPGWHQPASLLGCIINMDAWKKLPPDLKAIVEEAGKATVLWSYSFFLAKDVEAVENFIKAGTIITHLDKESLRKMEELAIKFTEIEAAKNPDYAKILKSMMAYLKRFEKLRDVQGPFGFGRNLTRYPEIK